MRTRRLYATCTNVLPSRSCVKPDFARQQPTSSRELSILVSLSLTLMNYGLLCSVNLQRKTAAQLYDMSRRILSRSRSGMVFENTCLMKPVSMISVSQSAFIFPFSSLPLPYTPARQQLVAPLPTSHHQSTYRQLSSPSFFSSHVFHNSRPCPIICKNKIK